MRRTILLAIAVMASALVNVAQAEIVKGTFTYRDTNNPVRPMAGAYVEVWQQSPGGFWGSGRSTFADSTGHIEMSIPFRGPGTNISLRIYALNRAVDVRIRDLYSGTFYQQPGPPGASVVKTSQFSSDVHDFSFNFTDDWAFLYFNVANVILKGREYADARRDPRETDPIVPVFVHISSVTSTFTDVGSNVIHLDDDRMAEDLTILHEYAHMLENEISSFQAWGAPHNGCDTYYDPPRYAWMEGFADYFAIAVAMMMPGEIDTLNMNMAPESPSGACPGVVPPFVNIENFVAGALRDLIDGFNAKESSDRMCSRNSGIPNDVRIFQIFDRELEIGPNNPRLQDFVNGWIARGFSLPPLLKAFGPIASELTLPAPTLQYDAFTKVANKAVWSPSTGLWSVLGSSSAMPKQWGLNGDVPLPADYDGDGFTDLAVWRPGDGNWWVISSATNREEVQQWGQAGDVPLPADYDGDGEVDYAVYRPSGGNLFVFDDECAGGTLTPRFLGAGTPFVGDFDNDRIGDPGLYDSATGNFKVFLSRPPASPFGPPGTLTGYLGPGGLFSQIVVGNFDNDEIADVGRFDAQSSNWTIRMSATSQTQVLWFGAPGRHSFGRAVPADYDGNGRTDLAIWTADGSGGAVFHINGQPSQQWGLQSDIPVPAP